MFTMIQHVLSSPLEIDIAKRCQSILNDWVLSENRLEGKLDHISTGVYVHVIPEVEKISTTVIPKLEQLDRRQQDIFTVVRNLTTRVDGTWLSY